uniref:Splicing factor YJU2 n=1 Tax=Simocephalus serrulatus TaxID=117539 RepID=A0A4Y7NMS7_9CRUS|nr:EOG090X0G3U [Simocephalus serrulatus]SVE94568.1 EOG090X0G3U [Simocephalus serrulatus]
MSERKVLNKYYPPDFDPSKIPRVRQAKNRQFTVRLMAPFNMKCKTCGEYIYKGKKFNARKEDVDNENYLGIRIYRFYIKCTRCLSEISFKTDPASTDYVVEAGATRNFMALKLAEEQAVREMEAEKEEERTNPMKLLENRTKASRGEIEMVETLEELKELNKRKVVVNFDDMLHRYDEERQTEAEVQENEDELLIKSVFGERTEDGLVMKRLADDAGSRHLKKVSRKFEQVEVLETTHAPTHEIIWRNDIFIVLFLFLEFCTAGYDLGDVSMRKTNKNDSIKPQHVPRRSITKRKTSTSANRKSLFNPAARLPPSIRSTSTSSRLTIIITSSGENSKGWQSAGVQLASHLPANATGQLSFPSCTTTPVLLQYNWPGNSVTLRSGEPTGITRAST